MEFIKKHWKKAVVLAAGAAAAHYLGPDARDAAQEFARQFLGQ